MSGAPSITGPATPEEAAAAVAALLASRAPTGESGDQWLGERWVGEMGMARWRSERVAALRQNPPTSG